MTLWGLCDNANYDESTLTIKEAQELRIGIRRTIVMPTLMEQLKVVNSARRLKTINVHSFVVFTTQSSGTAFADVDGYCNALTQFLDKADGALFGIELQNELDTPQWGITNDEIVYVAQRGAEVVHNYGLKAFAPSLLSGPEEGRFEYIAARIHDDVDYMAVHPYYCSCGGYPRDGWFFGTVENKADICAELCPWIPTAFTEGGCTVGYDGTTENHQAGYSLSARDFNHPSIFCFTQFCRDDYMVPNGEMAEGKAWGLIDRDGMKRRAYTLLKVVNVDPTFELGFKEWHDLEPDLIGDALENEFGGIEGISMQRTTNGHLLWTAEPNVRVFYDNATGDRYALYPDEQQSTNLGHA